MTKKQALDTVKWLEMKTRIKMQSKDWHHGFQLYDRNGEVAYVFLPRVMVKK
jgi:hypothetical protein